MKRIIFIFAAIAFFINGAEAQINLVSNGNVMIGDVTTPITRLHVNGNTYLPGNNSYYINSTSDAGSRLRLLNNGSNSYIDYSTNLYFRYGSSGSHYGAILHSNGYMSINYGYLTADPTYPLQVNGYILANGQLLPSDSRFKKNIEDLSNNKSKLLQLKGVKFDYISEVSVTQNSVSQLSNSKNYIRNINDTLNNNSKTDTLTNIPISRTINSKVTSRKHFGFIAQDLKVIFPELVFEDKDGYLSVDYMSIIPMLVEALKEQDSILSIQSIQIKELQKVTKNRNMQSAQLSTLINSKNSQKAPLTRILDPTSDNQPK